MENIIKSQNTSAIASLLLLSQIFGEAHNATTVTVFTDYDTFIRYQFFEKFLAELAGKYSTLVIDVNEILLFEDHVFARKSNGVVVFVSEEVKALHLRWNPLWSTRARVLVVTNNESQVLTILRSLWQTSWTVNATVVVMNGEMQFYTWFPYTPNECGEVKTIIKLNTSNLFPVKFGRNLNACPIRVVSAIVMPYVENERKGIESEIMIAIAKSLNLTIKYIKMPENVIIWDWQGENGEILGPMKMLIWNELDVLFSSFMRTYQAYQSLNVVVSHTETSMIWCVPTPAPISKAVAIYKAFSPSLWTAFLLGSLGILLTCFIFNQLHPEDETFSVLLQTWALVLYQPGKETRSVLYRIFLIITYLYSLHITSAYQSSLLVFLTSVFREKAIETMEDIADSNLDVTLQRGSRFLYNHSKHEVWNELFRPGRVHFNPYLWPADVAMNKTSVLIGPKEVIENLLNYNYLFDKYGFPYATILKEPIMTSAVAFYLTPGCPLLSEFDRITQWLLEAGLPSYWGRPYALRLRKRKNQLVNESFGLDNLEGAFWILLCALALGLVVFFVEIAINLFQENKVEGKVRRSRQITVNKMIKL